MQILFQVLEGLFVFEGPLCFPSPPYHLKKKAWHLTVALDMNQLNAANFPIRLYISFKLRGDLICTIAWILSGFTSIP